ncbi:SdpI family protein [Nesterenkonia salmonea]|uniref:SdpI family protein n=1 Tax=Nesterenkonia salmonea TaxID=1804987 RepID=A0A5R9BAP9_9MICC|nr:SdpI family protein [Nesterenkonia salmonea]TLP94078.1 SdpI family protein [Nesterenkonia salmonea]
MDGGISLLITGLALAPAVLMLHMMAAQVKSGKLTRNYVWGLRTRKLQSSDEAWDIGHRAAQPHLYALAYWTYGAMAACVLGALVVRSEEAAGVFIMVVIGGFTAAVLIHAWRAVVVAHRAVDQRLELAEQLVGSNRAGS